MLACIAFKTSRHGDDEQEPAGDKLDIIEVYVPQRLTRSLGWMVTRLAWMAAKLVSSKRETR